MTDATIIHDRIDLFNPVHKGIRWWVGQLSANLGSQSFADPKSLSVLEELEIFQTTLDEHALHEDTFIAPLVQSRGGDRHQPWQDDHCHLKALETALREQTVALKQCGVSHPAIQGMGMSLYCGFNRFAAQTLRHLDEEETLLMPLLWSVCTDEELQGVLRGFLDRFGADAARFHKRVAAAYSPAERAKVGV